MEIPQSVTVRGETAESAWEIVNRPPCSALRPFVASYSGYIESSSQELRRLQVPHDAIVFIISLGPVLRVLDDRTPSSYQKEHISFVAGLHDAPVVTVFRKESAGIQVNMTPTGAHLFFDVEMSSLANRVVGVGDLPGPGVSRLVEQLMDNPDWDTRFAILDRFLLDRLLRAPAPDRAALRAWRMLSASHGNTSVYGLAADVGLTAKELTASFRREIGLSPKRAGRVLRFHHAVERLNADGYSSLAAVASDCGYYDQAHFTREFRQFAGRTPTEYLRSRTPVGVSG